MGGSMGLASTAAAGQANPRGSKFLFVCFRHSAKISARPVTKFQQKLLALIGYRGGPGGTGGLSRAVKKYRKRTPAVVLPFWPH